MAKKSKGLLSVQKTQHGIAKNPVVDREELHEDGTSRKYRCNRPKRKANNVLCYNDRVLHSSPTRTVQVDEHFEDIFKVLHELQKDNKHCDVMLKTKEGVVHAHSIVLTAATPNLYKKLDKPQSSESGDMLCASLNLSHIPHWVVEDLVSFIYSGKLQLLKNKINEFSKFCKSLGLLKLYEKLNSKSAVLPGTLQRDFNVQSSVNHVKESFSSLICVKKSTTGIKNRNKSDEENQSRGKVTHTTRKLKSRKGRVKKENCETETADEEKGPAEPYESKVNKSYSVCEDQSFGKKPLGGEEKSSVDGSEIQEKKTTVIRNEAKEDLSDTAAAVDEDVSIVIQKDQHESSQLERDTNEMKDVNVTEPDDDSYKISEDNESDSETEVEYSPPNKKAKHTDNDKSLKSSTTKVQNNHFKVPHCKRCKEDFETQEELKRHKKTCKGNRPRRRCILCQVSFATAEEYLHHRKTDEKCLDIQRQKHQRRLNRKAQLRARFSCRVCPRKFRRVVDNIDHEFVAHELPYDKEQWPDLYCEYCNYWTMNPWRLHHHKTYDCSKGQEYICDVCGNKYKNEKTLKCHKEMQHTDAMPMMPCDQCGKTLKGRKGLLHHIRIMHKGENPHKRHMCHFCSMKYTSSNDLTFHLHRVHCQPLPDEYVVYQCEECDYVINNKRTYEKHKMLHQDKRDFQCELCPKAFKTKNSLHTHMKSHNGKKAPCPYEGCSYAALKKCHLKTHIQNQHTQKGVKNEDCHMCSYSTFFKGNLIKHLRTVHQLEVVTRYSVQMKAKYKNLKTGDIIGKVDTPDPPKINKKPDPKNLDTVPKTKIHKSSTMDGNLTQIREGQFVTVSEGLVQHSRDIGRDSSGDKYQHLAEVTTQGQVFTQGHITTQGQVTTQGQMETEVLHNMCTNMAGPSISHPYIYAVNCIPSASNHPNNANNMNFMYGTPHDVSSAPGNSIAMSIPPPGGPIREVSPTMPSVYGNKISSGVAHPIVFQPQETEDDVNNAKMLTYLQI